MKALFANAGKSAVGTIPPREQLETFITLLNEFSMKKLAMSLDEWGESGNYVPVVMEFDVSIEPGRGREDEKAASQFVISNRDTDDMCASRRPIVYNQYPAMAAFNVNAVDGVSSGLGIAGTFKWLAVGASVNVQRQRDRLQQSMQQSVYISGYHEEHLPSTGQILTCAETKLGWFYGAPAFLHVTRAGSYATFAIVLVPKRRPGTVDEGTNDELCRIGISGST